MKLQRKKYHLFYVSKISFTYQMTAIDSTNDQRTMRRAIKVTFTH